MGRVKVMDNILINILETASTLAHGRVLEFYKLKYPGASSNEILEVIIVGENYTEDAQDVFNSWNEYYYDILHKNRINNGDTNTSI